MKRITYPTLLAIAAFTLFSCQKKIDTPLSDKPGKTLSEEEVSGSEKVILQLVNDVRKKGCNCGSTAMPAVDTVAWNTKLEAAAKAHAEDMSTNNYFNHTGLNGSTPGDRITAAGYEWKGYGENIAKGYSSEQAVVDAWIKSEGHCKNIMNGSFKEMGVAMVNNYWVQEFGVR